MPLDEALKYLRDARGAIDHVSVTGGEPFLNRARLEMIVAEAKALGYIVSIMTSAFWARDADDTRRTLRRLRTLGLDMIGVSLDRFHLAFVDEQRAINVAEAADELDLHVAVRVISASNDDYGDHVKAILEHTRAEVRVNYLVKLGRASTLPDVMFKSVKHVPRERCETVTAADVVPGGDVYACCGPGLYMSESNPLIIGNAQRENLFDILERGLCNPFMKVINTRGPNGLLEDLEAHGCGDLVKIRDTYTDACQLCMDICNNPEAVEVLQSIYARKEVRREQNAAQFLKMVADYKSAQVARKNFFPVAAPRRDLGNARSRIWGAP